MCTEPDNRCISFRHCRNVVLVCAPYIKLDTYPSANTLTSFGKHSHANSLLFISPQITATIQSNALTKSTKSMRERSSPLRWEKTYRWEQISCRKNGLFPHKHPADQNYEQAQSTISWYQTLSSCQRVWSSGFNCRRWNNFTAYDIDFTEQYTAFCLNDAASDA